MSMRQLFRRSIPVFPFQLSIQSIYHLRTDSGAIILPEASVQQYTHCHLQKKKKKGMNHKLWLFWLAPSLALRPSDVLYTSLFPNITNLITDSKI